MSFIIAGCALLLALLAGIVLDDVGVRRPTRRDLPSSISLTLFLSGSSLGLSVGARNHPGSCSQTAAFPARIS